MTLEQFVKPVGGRTIFTIYKGKELFLDEEIYNYTVLSDDEWEEARKLWKHHEPSCMSQTKWWPEVKDLEVNFWHIGDRGYRGPQVIIFLADL